MSDMKRISPDSKAVSYMGRIDHSDPKAPKVFFAGSCITLNFKGTKINAVIRNHKIYNIQELGVVIDGKQSKLALGDESDEKTLSLAEGLEDAGHEVILFKRQDASHWFEFLGFDIDGEALPAKPAPMRRIECFGDSVSAGAVTEAIDNVGMTDPEDNQGQYDNSWYSYSMITARNLGAQINNVAQGGIAIFDDTGYFHAPNCIGMETAYDKICYFPEGGYTDWDFSKYIPQVVLFAVGQNDPHNERGRPDNDITDADHRRKWKDRYKDIIRALMGHYPKAKFILLLTVLQHDSEWDRAVDEIKDELCAETGRDVSHFMFRRTGKATPGHPRMSEQYEMAEELTAFISSFGDDIWEDK